MVRNAQEEFGRWGEHLSLAINVHYTTYTQYTDALNAIRDEVEAAWPEYGRDRISSMFMVVYGLWGVLYGMRKLSFHHRLPQRRCKSCRCCSAGCYVSTLNIRMLVE